MRHIWLPNFAGKLDLTQNKVIPKNMPPTPTTGCFDIVPGGCKIQDLLRCSKDRKMDGTNSINSIRELLSSHLIICNKSNYHLKRIDRWMVIPEMKSSQICINICYIWNPNLKQKLKKRGKPETSISSGCSRHLAALACKNKLTTYQAMSGSRRANPFFLLSVAKAGAGIPQRFFWNEDGSHRHIIHHCSGCLTL